MNLDVTTELLRDHANLLECLTKRLRHLRQNAFSMGRAWVPGQIVQVGRAQLRVAQPLIDHVWRYPREAVLAAKILLSHARLRISGWE